MSDIDQLRFFCLGLTAGIGFFTAFVWMIIGGDR